MIIIKWIEETTNTIEIFGKEVQTARPPIICADGFKMTVRVEGDGLYSKYEDSPAGRKYIDVEVAELVQDEILFEPYRFIYKDDDFEELIYAHVPLQVVERVLVKHGGIADNIIDLKIHKWNKE